METLKKILNYIWLVVLAAFAVLFYMFKSEQNQKEEAEGKLLTANADKKDAVLAQKQSEVEQRQQEAIKKAEDEKGRTLTPDELEEFLRKL